MNIKKISKILEDSGISAEIFYYPQTDSTNTRAREYAKEHREERRAKIFLADSQTAGRGRRGRSFFSKAGVGIYLTLLLYPDERGRDAAKVTARAAVALTDALIEKTPLAPGIKWVNDIIAGGKKLAGILAECEMESDGSPAYIALGMGINVYKTELPEEISEIATSIESECGKKISREEIAASVIKNFLSDKPEDYILDKYRERSLLLGERITVHPIAAEPYPATAKAVLDDYSLLVKGESGEEKAILSGEVSIRKT